MHRLEIPEINYKAYFPEDLGECDPRQYIEMSALIFQYQTDQIDLGDFCVHGFYRLLNMRQKNKGKSDPEKESNIAQYSQLLETFFEKDDAGHLVIKQYYIHNPIPSFIAGFRTYYGPSDEFNNVKFGEYIAALESFIDYNQTGESQYLFKLVAALYRPKRGMFAKKDVSDQRRLFNKYEIERRAKKFQHLHVGIVYGIYLWFASFQKFLATAEITVEGQVIDLSVLFEPDGTKQKSKLPGIGMRGVLYSFAESGVFGNTDQTEFAGLWEIILRMYDIYKRNQDEEAAMAKATKK